MYSDQERRIFEYQVNGHKRFADPLDLEDKLETFLGGDLDRFLADAHAPEPNVKFAAIDRLAGATCAAFSLGAPFNPETGQGVPREVWVPLLNAFVEWTEKNVVGGEDSLTSLPPTATSSVAG